MGIEFLSQLLLHIDQHMVPGYLYQEIVTLLARLHDYKLQMLALRLDELVACVNTLSTSSDQQMLGLLGVSSVEGCQSQKQNETQSQVQSQVQSKAHMFVCSMCMGSLLLQSKHDTCFSLDYMLSHDVMHSHHIEGCVEKTADILRVMNEIRSLFLLLSTPLVYGTDLRLQSQQLVIKNSKMSL